MEFTDQNFKKEVEDSKELVLVDFFAEWCSPCKLMAPIVEGLVEKYKGKNVKIGKADVDKNKDASEKYNIMGIPALLLFKDGKVIEQATGYQSEEFLEDLINKNL